MDSWCGGSYSETAVYEKSLTGADVVKVRINEASPGLTIGEEFVGVDVDRLVQGSGHGYAECCECRSDEVFIGIIAARWHYCRWQDNVLRLGLYQ